MRGVFFMPKKNSRREETNSLPIKRIGICSVIGAALYFLEIIAFSAAELKLSFGAESYFYIGIAAAFISAFIAGFSAVIKQKSKALPCGAATGAIQAVISDILLAVINKGGVGKGMIFVSLASILGAAIGGIVAANIKPKVRY